MALHVTSRVNGLKVFIPSDARGVIHRFAIGGGGNELVFEPIKRKMFDSSKKLDTRPVEMGGDEPDTTIQSAGVALTENVVDDDDDEPAPRKKRTEPDPLV